MMELTPELRAELQCLEQGLWSAEKRSDPAWLDSVLGNGFYEIGRTGKTYTRDELLSDQEFNAEFSVLMPLPEFTARAISDDVVLLTYISEVTYGEKIEKARRSTIWTKNETGWQAAFHQGTPLGEADA